jgi:hypothetical protein
MLAPTLKAGDILVMDNQALRLQLTFNGYCVLPQRMAKAHGKPKLMARLRRHRVESRGVGSFAPRRAFQARLDSIAASMNVAAAVHVNRRAGDVGGEVGRKKQTCPRDIRRLSQALERNTGGNLLGHRLCHIAVEHAGLNH